MAPWVGVFGLLLTITNIQARHHHSSSIYLDHLLSQRSTDTKSPVIVIIDSTGHQTEDSKSTDSDERNDISGDDRVYQLSNMLKPVYPSDFDSSGEKSSEEKKHLRALVARCRKMNQCTQKCPKNMKFSCVVVCQQKYDRDNECDEPEQKPQCNVNIDECGPKKQGKTMPPYWLVI